jgi:pSer/pThr/pTyr-binding forkhead associated (FHA) protein
MPAYLEIIDGPAKGRKIPLSVGKTVSVGRSSAKSMIALPDDQHLSGQHFTVGLRNGNVFLCNLSKTNPTEVNGSPIQSAVLKPGDRFKAGVNVFSVVAPENPHPAEFRLGGWGFKTVPEGWEIKDGVGLRHREAEPFRANLIAAEEPLPKDFDLPKYVELQVSLGKKHLAGATFSDAKPAKIKGAENALALTIHAPAEKGPAVQFQIYAVHSGIVGIITTTGLETQASLLRSLLTQVLPGLTFFQA